MGSGSGLAGLSAGLGTICIMVAILGGPPLFAAIGGLAILVVHFFPPDPPASCEICTPDESDLA